MKAPAVGPHMSISPPHTYRDADRWVLGLHFPNPIGLAAGYDRDGSFARRALECGFGFVEIGTLRQAAAGGCSATAAIVERNLLRGGVLPPEGPRPVVIGVNIGAYPGIAVCDAWRDYLAYLRAAGGWADYATLNLTSEAAAELRMPHHAPLLSELFGRATELAARMGQRRGRPLPLLVKLPLDMSSDWTFQVALSAVGNGIDGLVADQIEPIAGRWGLARLAASLPRCAAIVSVGGIDSAREALARLEAGAHLLQIHRGFQRRGSALVDEIRCALSKHACEPGIWPECSEPAAAE